jgi:hypothetical protein
VTSAKPLIHRLNKLLKDQRRSTELTLMFMISSTRTSKDSLGQDLRNHSLLMAPELPSHLLSFQDPDLTLVKPLIHRPSKLLKDQRVSTELMLMFMTSLTRTLIDLTGQDLRRPSSLTDPRLLSQLLFINIEDTTETSVKPLAPKLLPERRLMVSMLKSTVLPTPWLIESTGTDPRSLSSQTDPRLLSHLPFTNTEETTETSVRPSAPKLSLERRLTVSMPKFTDSPTPWLTESTGTDPRSLSSQMDPRLLSHLPFTNNMLTNTLKISLTRK